MRASGTAVRQSLHEPHPSSLWWTVLTKERHRVLRIKTVASEVEVVPVSEAIAVQTISNLYFFV